MCFKERLKELRKREGLSQEKLGQSIGIHSVMISKYERGITQPGAAVIIKMATHFSVTTDYLLGFGPHN